MRIKIVTNSGPAWLNSERVVAWFSEFNGACWTVAIVLEPRDIVLAFDTEAAMNAALAALEEAMP